MTARHEAATMAGIILFGLTWYRTSRTPLAQLALIVLHLRATWLWLRAEGWPALLGAARRYPECVGEVRRWG